MTAMTDLKTTIQALTAFGTKPLAEAATALLNALGYRSDKRIAGAGSSPKAFLDLFGSGHAFDQAKALFYEWKTADLLFQLTDQELSRESSLFTDDSVQRGMLKSYIFIAIELKGSEYARGKFSAIARQINRLFPMPVMVFFKHQTRLTIAVINRRRNKIDDNKDVLEKATIIRDINFAQPHRGHLDILDSLALPKLVHPKKLPITDFDTLHAAWEQIFNVELLNERFYRELANWYFWALPQVEFPSDLEPDDEKRRATGLIRLLTRLIFCWFLKEKNLIPEKLFHPADLAKILKGFDPESETSSTYYQAILQNLFFATLNQRMYKDGKGQPYRRFVFDEGYPKNKTNHDLNNYFRYEKLFALTPDGALALFEDIPFLNGGLFECLDKRDEDDKKTFYLDGFSRNAKKRPHVPDRLFFDSGETADLSEVYGDKKRRSEKVTGLITILNRYKFTIVENTPIDQEIALDPELLGKVFENLLASYNEETKTTARKQTGSFYTPRPIVEYMVDESLKAHLSRVLVEKAGMKEDDAKAGLDLLFTYTEKEHPFSVGEVDTLITAIDEVKILDPACGSGAFPMGVLHKLVYILGKLDPDNDRWKQAQLAKLDSAPMREELERAFADNNDDYGRKLYLIENCLYGVDIQPIAIQITKLRFFISLVCDQKTNRDKAKNHGIRPLPNLETKFVAANTLIGLPIPEPDLFLKTLIEPIETEIEVAYHGHFTIQRRDQKLALQKKIKTLRQKLTDSLLDGLGANKGSEVARKAQHLADWDPFDPQSTANFFDPHWMFGRSLKNGFDIVIANPPYLKERDNKHLFAKVNGTALGELYHDGKMDYWYYFLHRAIDISRKRIGLICFITSRYWINSKGARKLIKRIKNELSFLGIVDIGDLKVFEAVAGHHMVALYGKESVAHQVPIIRIRDSVSHLTNQETSEFIERGVLQRESIISDAYEIVLRDDRVEVTGCTPLGDLCEISQGVVEAPDKVSRKQIAQSGRNDLVVGTGVFVLGEDEVRQLNLNQSELSVLKPYLDPKDIGRCWIAPRRRKFLIYSDRETRAQISTNPQFKTLKKHLDRLSDVITSSNGPYGLHRPREPKFFENRKILIPSMFSKACFALDEQNFYVGMSFSVVIARDRKIGLEFILAILNSDWGLKWFYANGKHRGSGVDIGVEKLRSFPVPSADDAAKRFLTDLVKEISGVKKKNHAADTSALEREIDQLVYALYGLTPEEIAIVEGGNR
jgi:adenine-specific DNA-methyltransferase